jgi:hypothetical protein
LQLKKDFDDVYEAGKMKNEQDFWDRFQNKGVSKMNYQYAFAYSHFNDTNYNPQYPIKCTDSTTGGRYVFYQSAITDTKVPIYAPTTTIPSMFYEAGGLKTIRLLNVYASTKYDATLNGCSALETLIIEGTIGQSGFNVKWSTKLSKDSIISIIKALSSDTSGITITVSKTAVNAIDWSNTVIDGVTYNTFDEVANTKSNWTISLA